MNFSDTLLMLIVFLGICCIGDLLCQAYFAWYDRDGPWSKGRRLDQAAKNRLGKSHVIWTDHKEENK
jgi:hypothetical protein